MKFTHYRLSFISDRRFSDDVSSSQTPDKNTRKLSTVLHREHTFPFLNISKEKTGTELEDLTFGERNMQRVGRVKRKDMKGIIEEKFKIGASFGKCKCVE